MTTGDGSFKSGIVKKKVPILISRSEQDLFSLLKFLLINQDIKHGYPIFTEQQVINKINKDVSFR